MGLGAGPKRVDLAEIMDQSEPRPLYIHLQLGPYREAVPAVLDCLLVRDQDFRFQYFLSIASVSEISNSSDLMFGMLKKSSEFFGLACGISLSPKVRNFRELSFCHALSGEPMGIAHCA